MATLEFTYCWSASLFCGDAAEGIFALISPTAAIRAVSSASAEDRHHLGYIPTNQTDFVRSLTDGKFPYRCECHIYQGDDEANGYRFYYGFVYIKRKDTEQ